MAAVNPTVYVALYLLLIILAVLIFLLYRNWSKKQAGTVAENGRVGAGRAPVAAEEGDAGAGAAGIRRRRAGGLDRMRRRQNDDEAVVDDGAGIGDVGEVDGSGSENDDEEPLDRRGQRKAEKEAQRAARQEEIQARQAKQEAQRKKDDARAEIRAKKEAEREAIEKAKEEEERKKQEEELKRQEEEFNQWKDLFSVAGEGSAEAEMAEQSQGLLQDFIEYIKSRKVVVLDEIATHFHLKTADVVSRIESLEASGELSGILDDRGKFIYITEEEMSSVVNYIHKRGRVNINELVAESNKLIDLTGSHQDAILADEEEETAAAS